MKLTLVAIFKKALLRAFFTLLVALAGILKYEMLWHILFEADLCINK